MAGKEETQAWRILLFGRNGSEMLLFRWPSGFRLPELHIPRWQRIAPNLNAEAKRLWNLDTICLFPFELDRSAMEEYGPKYHLMEVCSSEDLARVAPDSLMVSVLENASFADRRDCLAVQQGMKFDGASFSEKYRGPFSEFGSFQKISAWVQSQLHPIGLRWDGCFRQLQASASFALIRFQTESGAVWFKAVGEPNTREFPITKELTAKFPLHLPVSLGGCLEWNAWLTKEAEGHDLFACTEFTAWRRAAESLADLQIASIQKTSNILAAGASDVRPHHLLSLVHPFFEVLERMMEQQSKAVPPPLDAHEINTVKEQVVSLLQHPDLEHIPDTLNHLDPNPGNIFVSEDKCTFLDWAEAGVGNPFFTFEYLRQHFRRTFSGGEGDDALLCDSYVRRWTSVLPRDTAERMLRIAPLMALFAYATSLTWNAPDLKDQPELAALLRSLGRRMHLESEHLKRVESARSNSGGERHGHDMASVLGTSKP